MVITTITAKKILSEKRKKTRHSYLRKIPDLKIYEEFQFLTLHLCNVHIESNPYVTHYAALGTFLYRKEQ